MALAVNYSRWILDKLKPFIGKHIVEVGAGAGSFSQLLLETVPSSMTLLEPSLNLYSHLRKRLPKIDKDGIAQAHHNVQGDPCGRLPEAASVGLLGRNPAAHESQQ